MENTMYAAYGSNINIDQMLFRCPSAQIKGVGYAENAELAFSKVADLKYKKGSKTPVVLWQISKEDEKKLDHYEGYPYKYTKTTVFASVGKQRYPAMAYVRTGTPELEPPTDEYYNRIEAGYTYFNLDTAYLEDACDRAVEAYEDKLASYDTIGKDKVQEQILHAFLAGQAFERWEFGETSERDKLLVLSLLEKEYRSHSESFEQFCDNYFASFFESENKKLETLKEDHIKYIAYGSNMNLNDMKMRCPKSEVLYAGTLEDYALKFNGCATIRPQKGKSTPVVVWDIHPDDWKVLDRYEGYPSFYRKETVKVKTPVGNEDAVVYVMNCPDDQYAPPNARYFEIIKAGYKQNGINTDALETALKESVRNRKPQQNVIEAKRRKRT